MYVVFAVVGAGCGRALYWYYRYAQAQPRMLLHEVAGVTPAEGRAMTSDGKPVATSGQGAHARSTELVVKYPRSSMAASERI